MLALNFYFLPPIGTFTIADPQNWVALLAFLVAAVDRQPAVRRGAGAGARGGRSAQRTGAALRSQPRRAADDGGLRTRWTRWRGTSRGGSSSNASRSACRGRPAGTCIRAASATSRSTSEQLNVALARAGATLEFDARQRTYGGHAGGAGCGGRRRRCWCRCASGRGRSACSPRPRRVRAGHARRRRGLRGDRRRARAAAGRAPRGGAAAAARGSGVDAARVGQPRSADAADGASPWRSAICRIRISPRTSARRRRGTAQVELERLTRLVRDILDMARIDAKAIELRARLGDAVRHRRRRDRESASGARRARSADRRRCDDCWCASSRG